MPKMLFKIDNIITGVQKIWAFGGGCGLEFGARLSLLNLPNLKLILRK
jgi:hypothetical protein